MVAIVLRSSTPIRALVHRPTQNGYLQAITRNALNIPWNKEASVKKEWNLRTKQNRQRCTKSMDDVVDARKGRGIIQELIGNTASCRRETRWTVIELQRSRMTQTRRQTTQTLNPNPNPKHSPHLYNNSTPPYTIQYKHKTTPHTLPSIRRYHLSSHSNTKLNQDLTQHRKNITHTDTM